VHVRDYSDFENALKYCDKNGIFLLKLCIRNLEDNSSSEEDYDINEEEAVANPIPDQADKSNLRNSKIFLKGYDEYTFQQQIDENPSSMLENSKINDKYFDAFPSKGSNIFDVTKPAQFLVLNRIATDARPKQNKVTGLFKSVGNFIGITDETVQERMEYAVVDEAIPEYSNEDIILAFPGSVIKKTWRIANKQCKIIYVLIIIIRIASKWPTGIRLIYGKKQFE
jgi:hypothetical protein